MIKYIGLILFSLMINGCASLSSDVPYEIIIVESGIYGKLNRIEHRENLTTASERTFVTQFNSSKLIESTKTIQLKKGASFGLYYKIESENTNKHFVTVTLYPPQSLVNPKTGKSTDALINTYNRRVGAKYFSGFTFDHNYEMLPGQWSIEIKVGDKIQTTNFNLVI